MPVSTVPSVDAQVDRLVSLGWPKLAGLPERAFRSRLASLSGAGVVVVTRRLVDPFAAVPSLELHGRSGFTSMTQPELASFVPLPSLSVPDVDAYLLLDVSPGPDTLNLPPDAVLPSLVDAGRSPLTVEEGVAVVAQQPSLLVEDNCFSLAGSRCGDKRVPAIWLSARRPWLGWCWEGAPHTWLGTASCAGRVAAG
ncbi:MAG: hypothetical protein EPN99_09230 [Frankiales bacterium]|nr:MAG: hypothetical protein EPN99_09230 [Frankiales bacterium]